MTHSYSTAPLLLSCLLYGCAAVDDRELEARRHLMLNLQKACIEANGGLQMDSVGLYAGRLSANCSTWAYREARKAVR